MATTASLQSASEAYTVQAQIAAAAVVAARSVRPQTAETIAATVAAYQALAAQQGAAAVPSMLAEQGISTAASASVITSALVGYTSAGAPLSTMFETFESVAQLSMLAASAVQDAGRNGASLGMVVRPSVTGYVRMLNPPSCSRCAVLAGRFYAWNQGFERHPNCDCRHIPSNEDNASDLTTNPNSYFDSLPSAAELDERYPNLTRDMRREADIYSREDIFGVAGSAAILDGADISQVVNARRGMRKAQLFGREAFETLEGTTRRGVARKAMGSGRPARLMPESIYAFAKDRDDALRLLKLYGYIS